MPVLNTTKPFHDALMGSFRCEGFREITEKSLLIDINMQKNDLIDTYGLYRFDFITEDDDLYKMLHDKKFHVYKMESYVYEYRFPSVKFTNYCGLEKICSVPPWTTYGYDTKNQYYKIYMFLLIPKVDIETMLDVKRFPKVFLENWPVMFNFTDDGLIIKYNGIGVFKPAAECKDEILGTKKIPIDNDEPDKMTLDGAIAYYEREAKEQYDLWIACPWSDAGMCTGVKDCRSMKHGKDKGCIKLYKEYGQLVTWLKDYKTLCDPYDAYSEQTNAPDKVLTETLGGISDEAILKGLKSDDSEMLEKMNVNGVNIEKEKENYELYH